jgi:hypothetical protein
MKCTEAGIKGLNLHLGRPGVFGSVFFLKVLLSALLFDRLHIPDP